MLTHRMRLESTRRATAAGLAVLALALLCAGARADEIAPNNAPASASGEAPAAAPPDEGFFNTVAKKLGLAADPNEPAAPPDEGIVKTIAKKLGLATEPGEPQDFVVKARPAHPGDYIPIGRKPFEREIKVKTPEELKAIEADLEAVRTRHDALRSTFAPAVKAVADAEAAKAAKAKKPQPPPASAQ